MKTDKIKNQIFVMFIICVIIIPTVSAIAVPHSIKGVVLDLDGATPIVLDTWFNLTNLETGQTITGKVGQGPYFERFSVSVSGIKGDSIEMFFWNKYHNTSRNFTLSGVINNAIVLINDSYPNNPPQIISTPEKFAQVGKTYNYDVDAVDPEGSEIKYNLAKWAPGMIIHENSGLIQWIPQNYQTGKHEITVKATDGDGLSSNQSFQVWVNKKKTKENLSATKKRFMLGTIDNILSETQPESTVINIEDSENEENLISFSLFGQTFYWGIIDVLPDEELTLSGNNDGLTGQTKTKSSYPFIFNRLTLDSYSDELNPDFKHGVINYFYDKPLRFNKKPINTVYAYIILDKEFIEEQEEPDKSKILSFIIPNDWLKKYQVDKDAITLQSYNDGEYNNLETSFVQYNEETLLFEAKVPHELFDCQTFTITVQDQAFVKALISHQIENEGIANTFLIEGIAFIKNKQQVPSGTLIKITNEGETRTFKTNTGTPTDSGGFSLFVEGQRQELMTLEIISENDEPHDYEFNLLGDIYLELRG